jgi:hypothetical protein
MLYDFKEKNIYIALNYISRRERGDSKKWNWKKPVEWKVEWKVKRSSDSGRVDVEWTTKLEYQKFDWKQGGQMKNTNIFTQRQWENTQNSEIFTATRGSNVW